MTEFPKIIMILGAVLLIIGAVLHFVGEMPGDIFVKKKEMLRFSSRLSLVLL